jgi:hypothetical protein
MKHLKYFEAEKKFQIGDIVVAKDVRQATDINSKGEWNWQNPKYIGKIIKYTNWAMLYTILVETSKYKDERYVPISRIMRLANPKELEEYNLKIATQKYNL